MRKAEIIEQANDYERSIENATERKDEDAKHSIWSEYIAFLKGVELCGYKIVYKKQENARKIVAVDVVPIEV